MPEPIRPDGSAVGHPAMSWVSLADALWLAAVVGLPASGHLAPEPIREGPPPLPLDRIAPPDPEAGAVSTELAGSEAEAGGAPEEIEALSLETRSAAIATARPGAGRSRSVLPASRQISRALQPFKRRVPSRIELEPDEEATADRAAEGGFWLPQMRPAPARWLALTVVVDTGPSMAVWNPTVSAFVRLLRQHGSFRRCREFLLTGAPAGPEVRILTSTGRRTCHPKELVDPSGGQIILVVTDGHDPLWQGQPIADVLRLWGSRGPLAIVNPYPQRYWHRTNLTPRRAQLRAVRPVTANSDLGVRWPAAWRNPFDTVTQDGFPVPVLELSPRWIRWWSQLVVSPSGQWQDATVFRAGAAGRPSAAAEREGTPRDRVFRFRSGATPLAFQLATQLAAAPLDLPLARRIQSAMLPESSPHHLAEVLSSDLVLRGPENGTPARPEFAAGVREVLLSCATRDDSAQVMRIVSRHYGDRLARAGALARVIEAPGHALDAPLDPGTLPLARIELTVLRALSGPYAGRADRLARSIALAETRDPRAQAEDAEHTASGPEPEPERSDDEQARTGGGSKMSHVVGGNGSEGPGSPNTPSPGRRDRSPLPGPDPRLSWGDPQPPLDLLAEQEGPATDAAIWGDVPPRNPVFTGREELLTQLERRLLTESMTAVLPQALHGMGGVGKSQIAIEYAYRNRSKYQLIWWIAAEQQSRILSSLVDLGQKMGHEKGLAVSDAVQQVQEALRAGAPYQDWLLIFDNAETLDAVRPYFPEAGSGKVLVTSRNPAWSEVALTLEVDVFTREESIRLLQRRNPDVTDEQADELAAALGDLPLAVEHASAWCATTGIDVSDYLVLLHEQLVEMESVVAAPGYELPVAAAWNVALEQLRQDNLPALRLLQVCSAFAPEPISRELFTSPRSYPTVPELDEALQNPSALAKAFRDIQRFGLAHIDHRNNTIQLHRLVKAVLIDRMGEERRALMEHGAHLLLAGGNPGTPDQQAQWPRFQELAPHVTVSQAITCEDPWARELVLDVIEFYYSYGDITSSRDLAQQAVDAWREQLGRDHMQTLRASKWLAYVQRTLGAFAQARAISQDCLERFQNTVGPDDEGTIDAMSVVAANLRVAGDFGQAKELDREALRRAEQALGEDDPFTLKAAHSLGVSLRLTGEFQEARQLDYRTWQRRQRILGEGHLETLLTLNGLTLDYRECGAYLQAHNQQEWLYSRHQSLFGANHPATIAAGRNLAVARRRAGYHEEARKLSEDTVRRYRQRFGEDNPETIASVLILAVDVREADDLVQAAGLGMAALDKYRAVLGPDHPYTLYARTNYAIVVRLLGRPEESYRHNSEVAEALRDLLGSDHILTLTAAVNLASDLSALGDHQRAYDLDFESLARSAEALGTEHPSTLASGLNLSYDLYALGRIHESARLFDETLDGYRRVLGENHPVIAAALARARANCDVDPMPL